MKSEPEKWQAIAGWGVVLMVLEFALRVWLVTGSVVLAVVGLIQVGTVAAILWTMVPMVVRRLRPLRTNGP